VLAAVEAHELMAFCRVPAMEDVGEQLAGPHFVRGGGFVPVLNFPTPGPREFVALRAHIDGINETTVWPVQRYAIILAYLSDTTIYGGALAVWPGSHRRVLEHWVSTGTGPEGGTTPPPLDYGNPVPVAAKTGDVVFMHYLLVHASSENHDNHVRVAINGTI
jgi:ectoine hydroxylase-related dioxygenase (phytanoyl-CoA dioxygenase family)